MTGPCMIDLLRHGDTGSKAFCGSMDVPLSDAGWQQMQQATQVGGDWQVVVSSPLRRCADFSKAYAEQNRLPLVLDAGFRELHFGDWEGKDAAQLMRTDTNGLTRFWTDPWRYTPSNGERLEDFEKRVHIACQYNCDRYAGKRILLITHAGVIRMLLCLAHQVARSALLSIEVPHASLHRLVWEG